MSQCQGDGSRVHYFALLGFAPDIAYEPTLAADYSKTLEDVAIDYGRYFIKRGLGLETLYFPIDIKSRDETLPS